MKEDERSGVRVGDDRIGHMPRSVNWSFGMDVTSTPRTAGYPPHDVPPAPSLPAVSVSDLSYSYGSAGSLPALEGVSFTVARGEFVALIGANGSGKSTLLRLIAGLLVPDRGSAEIDGHPVDGPDRRVGLVFQEPRLLPWRSTLDNVAFPLELVGEPRERREARARDLLRLVGLRGVDGARPHELSGGMRQRAAIARALALEPDVLLLDEPFSALDALTRERFNVALQAIWHTTATTVVFVTHSIQEAVFLGSRVLVVAGRPGRIAGEVPVPLPHPRDFATLDTVIFSGAAASIRELLAADMATVADEAGDPSGFRTAATAAP